MTFANNLGRAQAPRNVGPDLRPILFETRHQILLKTVYFGWDDLSSDDIQILSILQIVQELLEGTVLQRASSVLQLFRAVLIRHVSLNIYHSFNSGVSGVYMYHFMSSSTPSLYMYFLLTEKPSSPSSSCVELDRPGTGMSATPSYDMFVVSTPRCTDTPVEQPV